jgi:hypothetical protein
LLSPDEPDVVAVEAEDEFLQRRKQVEYLY